MRGLLIMVAVLAVFYVLCELAEAAGLGDSSPYMLLILAGGIVGYAVYGKEQTQKH